MHIERLRQIKPTMQITKPKKPSHLKTNAKREMQNLGNEFFNFCMLTKLISLFFLQSVWARFSTRTGFYCVKCFKSIWSPPKMSSLLMHLGISQNQTPMASTPTTLWTAPLESRRLLELPMIIKTSLAVCKQLNPTTAQTSGIKTLMGKGESSITFRRMATVSAKTPTSFTPSAHNKRLCRTMPLAPNTTRVHFRAIWELVEWEVLEAQISVTVLVRRIWWSTKYTNS